MRNYFVESHEHNPWKNLAIEKHLADSVQSGDLLTYKRPTEAREPVETGFILLYLWQNEHTVVIGRNQNALRECRVGLLEEEGGYLARRTTGGGAVYQDLGNLCFTFIASPEQYNLERQMKVIREACRKFGIETEFSGRNDIITKDGYKFSGNAFSVSSSCRIQHGTLMIDVDKEKLGRYLTPSEEKMKAKGVKSVASRVRNLKELNPEVTVEAMKVALRDAFEEEYGAYQELAVSELDTAGIDKTFETYASWDWRYGKSPECETVYSKRFSWGEVEVYLKLKNLYVQECKVYSDALDVALPRVLERVLLGERYNMNDVKIEKLPEVSEEQRERVQEVIEWLITAIT